MINQEDFAKQVKIITQNAWRQDSGGGTTLNSMVEYIVRESLAIILEAVIDHEERLEALERPPYSENKGYNNNGKNGGLSQPQGNQKAKSSRSSPDA